MEIKIKPILFIFISLLITVLVFLFADQIYYFKSLGYLGVFIISLLGSATIIIPAPSWTIVFIMAKTLDPILLGIFAGLGSAIGELTGYYLGKGSIGILDKDKKVKEYSETVNKYGAFAIFVFAFLPNPVFDFVGIAAGAMHMKMWKFLLASIIGKTIRFIIFAYLGLYTLNIVF